MGNIYPLCIGLAVADEVDGIVTGLLCVAEFSNELVANDAVNGCDTSKLESADTLPVTAVLLLNDELVGRNPGPGLLW